MVIDNEKQILRDKIKKIKKLYNPEILRQKSSEIFKLLENDEDFINAKTIMAYWSMMDEVFTHDFVNKCLGIKKILLPVVNGNELIIKEYTGQINMIRGSSFSIMEPDGEVFEDIDKIDLIVVPGVAFDKNNNRLGRGKAFYDKLLKISNAKKVGICFDFQMVDKVPVDKHDVKMEKVLYY